VSFQLDYRPLFAVAVQDDAAPPAALDGFAIVPTRACRRALAEHRLVFRAAGGSCRVLYASNPLAADSLLAPITGRVRFTFALRPPDPAFLERYHPTLTPDRGRQLYLDNLTASGNMQSKSTLSVQPTVGVQDAVTIRGPVFQVAVDLDVSPRPTHVRVLDRFDGSEVVSVPVPDGSSATPTIVRLELGPRARGAFALDIQPGGSAQTLYVDNELARLGPVGVIDVHWRSRQDTVPDDGVQYAVRFRRR
jgi:hypothetical protein